jgi:large subunit ribosomal protein L6e
MYHKKKGIWAKRNIKNPKQVKEKKPLTVEKKIKGDKNGGKRLVQVLKSKRLHGTCRSHSNKRSVAKYPQRKHKLRGTLTPGTVCILLAGRHSGKRVVFLKQLESGLLLVTGPFKINAVPLRRVNQQYVIATSTKLDISKLKLPEKFNDSYFRRDKKRDAKARKQQEGNIFASEKSSYEVSETRKTDQVEMDKSILAIVKAHPEKKMLLKYLGSSFGLKGGQYPHKMKF